MDHGQETESYPKSSGQKAAGLRVVTKSRQDSGMSLRLRTSATVLMMVSYIEVLLCIIQGCGIYFTYIILSASQPTNVEIVEVSHLTQLCVPQCNIAVNA